MKKSELIAALEAIPGDPNVKIFDHLKSLHHASGEPSDDGIYDFEVSQLNHDLTAEDIAYAREVHEVDPKPFIILAFDNEEFNEDGSRDE